MTKTKPFLQWQDCPNPHCKQIHTRFRIAPFRYEGSDHYGDTVPEGLKLLAKSILAINGVVSVSGRDYNFQILKGELFSWAELEPCIDRMVKAYIAKHVPGAPPVLHRRRPDIFEIHQEAREMQIEDAQRVIRYCLHRAATEKMSDEVMAIAVWDPLVVASLCLSIYGLKRNF